MHAVLGPSQSVDQTIEIQKNKRKKIRKEKRKIKRAKKRIGKMVGTFLAILMIIIICSLFAALAILAAAIAIYGLDDQIGLYLIIAVLLLIGMIVGLRELKKAMERGKRERIKQGL